MSESRSVPTSLEQLGNTRPVANSKKRISASKNWCFTLNNWTDVLLDYVLSNIQEGDEYVIGKEVGEQGTPHLQGYIKFKKECRPMERFKEAKEIHWEKCKGNRKDNIKYCTKDGDYITNINPGEIRTTKPLKLITELRPYQQTIVDIIKQEPDDRTIYWIYEEEGNVGKTQLCKYLSQKYNAVPLEGKKNDILYCAATYESEIYLYDVERSLEDYISYGAIEKIKNGYFMCAKYESKPIVRNSPHVIIFANFYPDTDKLSKDRWMIYRITNNYRLILDNETEENN